MTIEEVGYYRTKGLAGLKLIFLLVKKKGVTFSDGEYEDLRNAVGEILNGFFELSLEIERATIREELQQIKEEEIKGEKL